MELPLYDLTDPTTNLRVFRRPAELSSAGAGWLNLHYERRGDGDLCLPPHCVVKHWVIVRLNPLSEAIRTIEGKTVHEYQHRGCTAYLPHGTCQHVAYPKGTGDRAIILLDPSLVKRVTYELGVSPDIQLRPKFATSPDQLLVEVADQIERELSRGNPHGSLYADVTAQFIAGHIIRAYGAPTARRHAGSRCALAPRTMRRLIEYIESRLDEPLSLPQLAAQAGLSEYYFCRAFRSGTGLSPHRFIIARRLERARHLIKNSGMSIQEIALASGFCDASQFAVHFRKHVGVNPSMYRREEAWRSPLDEEAQPVLSGSPFPGRATGPKRTDPMPRQ